MRKKKVFCLALLFFGFMSAAKTQDTLSITLEGVKYAYPVQYFNIHTEGQALKMAFMDVKPVNPNGKTVMLFHGKNFGGYYWTNVIKSLSEVGFRVIVPDQIGFGKSSKAFIHYSFHELAKWNKLMLDSLGIQKTALLGHSMGGMLATRFALMYPESITKLLLENPIGLEDYKTFIPYINTEQQYQTELKTNETSIKKYYQTSYFTSWKPQYDELVRIAGGVTLSADFPRWAKVAAMTFTMIYEQPVLYEFPNLKVPTVLFIGQEDKTIVGKALLSPTEQAKHGQYKILGKATADRIPNAKLIKFEKTGHIPHLEVPYQFLARLLAELR
jgi:pimeloyl-ACP methyl ester carboxylesterase